MTTADQTEEILYVITNHKFPSDNYGNDDFLNNWPMLYILENGKKIYIGESTNVSERMKQHYNNHEKREFKQPMLDSLVDRKLFEETESVINKLSEDYNTVPEGVKKIKLLTELCVSLED